MEKTTKKDRRGRAGLAKAQARVAEARIADRPAAEVADAAAQIVVAHQPARLRRRKPFVL
jgi:hypothetical protein